MYGLKKEDLEVILNVIKEYSQVEMAIIFGSTTTENFSRASDPDIALIGDINDIL